MTLKAPVRFEKQHAYLASSKRGTDRAVIKMDLCVFSITTYSGESKSLLDHL